MFDEGARKILEAVKTGIYPGGGRYYNTQARSPMRPSPRSTDWEDRTLCVGMSPASVVEAGRLGARLMSFAQVPWEMYKETHLAPYLASFRETQRREPGPIVLAENVIVHEDRERARELALSAGDRPLADRLTERLNAGEPAGGARDDRTGEKTT